MRAEWLERTEVLKGGTFWVGAIGRPRLPTGEGLTVPMGTGPRPPNRGRTRGVSPCRRRCAEWRERVGEVGRGAGEKLRLEGQGEARIEMGEEGRRWMESLGLVLTWGEAGGEARRGEVGEGVPRRTFLAPKALPPPKREGEGEEGGGITRRMEPRGEEGGDRRIVEARGEEGGDGGRRGERAREGGRWGWSRRCGERGEATKEEGGDFLL